MFLELCPIHNVQRQLPTSFPAMLFSEIGPFPAQLPKEVSSSKFLSVQAYGSL